ncbi:outer membrane beta-barrel protein [Pontibacter indicus]|uniref:Outer membrane protein beta-barrel domain-containing protein n=1 Tax=Pontibacter indicus TaxID=1317125 RepID=A0A1R3XPB1_9BACT|nr:outer membrane beta-barrel protein [Pontibacter indicus]SIT93707.1 Outer membrane protein beta-barrel domain-containing protein [Pontibacter indicus]
MKTIYLFLLAMLVAGSAFAQLQTGTRFSGISAGIGFKKPAEGNKTFSYEVRPAAGIFTTDNLMLGLSTGYYYSIHTQRKTESLPDNNYYRAESETITRVYNLGPMARYHLPLGNRFALFAEGAAGVQAAKVKSESYFSGARYPGDPGGDYASKSESKQVSLYAGVSPGLVFFPSTHIGIDLKVNLLRYQHDLGRGSHTNVDFSLSRANLGIGLYF